MRIDESYRPQNRISRRRTVRITNRILFILFIENKKSTFIKSDALKRKPTFFLSNIFNEKEKHLKQNI